MSTFLTVATELAGSFVTDTRLNEAKSKFYKFKDGAPDWMTEAVFQAHEALGGRSPDDWVYAQVAAIAESMVDHSVENSDDVGDASHEICDGLVDVYNHDLVAWLGQHGQNPGLCDEAAEELGTSEADGLIERISRGQFFALTRIYGAVATAVLNEAASRDGEGC